MAEEATVTLYRIGRCGYFDTESGEHRFSTIPEVFSNVERWLDGKALGDTCTYVPNEDIPFLRTFCLDYLVANDAALFVSWNESERGVKGVRSINENDAVGSASIKTVSLGKNDIPGYPAFFWILPQDGLAINVRFSDDRQNGSQPFQHYMRQFLYIHSDWCVFGARGDDDDVPLLGYARDEVSEPEDLEGHFDTHLNHRGGEISHLMNNRENIIRIIRKKYLRVRCHEDNDLVTRLLIAARVKDPKMNSFNNRVRYELPFKPSTDQLNNVIDSWNAEEDDGDIGFRLKGETNRIYWLGKALSREKIILDVVRKGDGMIDSASLLDALFKRKGVILSLRE